MEYSNIIDWPDQKIEAAIDANRLVTKEKYGPYYITEDEVLDDFGHFVHVENFYNTIKKHFLSLIHEAREVRKNAWDAAVYEKMMKLEGACMFLLAVLRGDHAFGEVFDIAILEAQLEEVLEDSGYALDMFKEYDDCASPLGMSEWNGYHSKVPMISIA